MKKRLRKKLHKAEFKEFGVSIAIKLTQISDCDTFLDEFIEDAVEAYNCYFGGGVDDDVVTGILDLGGGLDQAHHRFENIITWMKQSQHIHEYAASDLQDIWYGDFNAVLLGVEV